MRDVPENGETRIRSTLLSGKPRDESLEVSLVIAAAIGIVSAWAWRDPAIFRILSASTDRILSGREYWRLLTTVAVHGDLQHLAVNMVYLVYFGYLLYGYFGFWSYPFAMLVLASLTTLLSLLTYRDSIVLIGASGLVYLMAGFWLVMYGLIERTISPRKRLLRIIGITLIVLVPSTLRPEVSYRTHAIGAALGSLAAIAWFASRKEQIRAAELIEPEPLDMDE